MKRALVALLLVLGLAAPASARPDRISFLLGSHHIGADQAFEEFNPGLFVSWGDRKIDWSLGVFRNSYGKVSVAATGAFTLWKDEAMAVSVFGGLALYPEDGRNFRAHLGDVVPIGGLQANWRNLFVQVIPLDGGLADAVVSVGLTFELDR